MSQSTPETSLESKKEADDELPEEYDAAQLAALLKNGVRGKYTERYRQGTNIVKLASDVARAFPTEQAVNEALRELLQTRQAATAKAA